MKLFTLTHIAILSLILAGIGSCRKDKAMQPTVISAACTDTTTPPDYFSKMAGEWNCTGENTAAHVAFSSPTAWVALDTSLTITGRIMKIEKIGNDSLQVTFMAFDQYMAFSNVGTVFHRRATTQDTVKIEFAESHYESMYGYGSGRRLTYYINKDSIYYHSDYNSMPDKFSVTVHGHRN